LTSVHQSDRPPRRRKGRAHRPYARRDRFDETKPRLN
jgi:hypothetical protein